MGVLGSLVGTLWVAPWGISPGVTEPRWNEACKWASLSAPWRGSPLGSPFTGKKRRYLFPSCSSRLTWGMMGISELHKGRESPCQPFPLHSQVETVNTHLPYCCFSLLLLFLQFFVWFFDLCWDRISLCRPSWLGRHDPSASDLPMLDLLVCPHSQSQWSRSYGYS